MRLVRYPLIALAAILALALTACGSGPAPTPIVREVTRVATPTPGPTLTPVVLEVTKVATPTPGPTPTPVVLEVTKVATPTPGPSPTPVVQEVRLVVTATPSPPPPPADTPTPLPATRTVIDDLRREVEIPYRPQRVAVTNAWMVEVLMACDYTPVARPEIPLEFVFPPEAHDIPIVAVSHSAGPNLEQLAAARPDLVITSPTYGRFAEPIQAALGVPALIYDVNNVDDVLAKIEDLGNMVGCEAKAVEAAADLRERIAAVQADLPDQGPEVFAIFGTSESFLGFTAESYLGDMVERLGGHLITEGDPPYIYRGRPDPAYTPFSLEKVVERDPDVILVVRHGGPSEAREENFGSLFSNPAWAGLRAVQEGRVHELSEWLYLRYPGPRVVWAMEELRPLLYPDEQ